MSSCRCHELKELLRQELLDEVIDVGHLGVYELVWSLRGRESSLTDPERVVLARRVAREVLSTGRVALYPLRWPSNNPISQALMR